MFVILVLFFAIIIPNIGGSEILFFNRNYILKIESTHCAGGTFDGIRKDIYSILVSFISCFIAISCWRPIDETFMLWTTRIANKNLRWFYEVEVDLSFMEFIGFFCKVC